MSQPTTPRVPRPPSVDTFELNRRIRASDLSPAAKCVLFMILDHARYGASTCTASNRTLARETGVSERWIKAVIPDLAARRLIRVERATASKHSRRTICIEPTIQQVGSEFPLRMHEVGTEFPVVGTECPPRWELSAHKELIEELRKSVVSLPSPEEEIDPNTIRWFGPPPRRADE